MFERVILLGKLVYLVVHIVIVVSIAVICALIGRSR